MRLFGALVLGVALICGGPTMAQAAAPPVAAKKPYTVKSPNGDREDDYYWLRDDTRKNPDMLAVLGAENAHADAVLAKTKPLADTLYGEIVGRIQQDDSSVPVRERGYWYYRRFEPGADYPVLARRKGAMTAPEEVMLDQPKMAAGKGFFEVGDAVVSQDNRLLAYAEDTVGRRQYVLRFKNLETGETLADAVPNAEADFVWADDNRTVFYVEKDPVTLLSRTVKAHALGTPASADRTVYQEGDDSFYMGLFRTRSDKYLCIGLQSTVSNEFRCASAADPTAFEVFTPRQREVRYDIDHLDGRWVIRTDWNAKNYQLMTLEDGELWGDRALWKTLVAPRDDVFIGGYTLFHGAIAISQRSGGLKRVVIRSDTGETRDIPADDTAYSMSLRDNGDVDNAAVRYTYDTLVTPTITYETDLKTGTRTLLKQQPAPGYEPSQYVTERVWVTARDGVRIPVSLAYRKGFERNGKAAMLQYAYGSYGLSMDPSFSAVNPSLMDRGMVYALAHIRGGQEMGRAWYDDGHLLHKKTSFTDFIDVTRGLVAQGWAAKDRVAAMGGSAGGLLMGAIANVAPEDYRVIVAQVPFVDVVTTMLDESIPLTTNEFDEWGNPKQKAFYDYMLSYSPYDNVAPHSYPAMFVSTGLWDSQVQYYEPAKWVAKLRAMKTDDNPLVFRINMEAGHGGKSGRFRKFHDTAEADAFMLDALGVER
jgi:oligopeptidase B